MNETCPLNVCFIKVHYYYFTLCAQSIRAPLCPRNMSNQGSFVRSFFLQFLCASERGGRDPVGRSGSGVLHELP